MSALPSARILQNQLKQLHKEPVDGFTCELRDDKLYEWIVYMRGPPDTYYEGGIFKLYMVCGVLTNIHFNFSAFRSLTFVGGNE